MNRVVIKIKSQVKNWNKKLKMMSIEIDVDFSWKKESNSTADGDELGRHGVALPMVQCGNEEHGIGQAPAKKLPRGQRSCDWSRH